MAARFDDIYIVKFRLLFCKQENEDIEDDDNEEDIKLLDFEVEYQNIGGIEMVDFEDYSFDEGNKIVGHDLVSVINQTIFNTSSDSTEPELHHLASNFLILQKQDLDASGAVKKHLSMEYTV